VRTLGGLRRRLAVVEKLAMREAIHGPSMPLTMDQRLSLWRHGYTSRSGVLFGLLDGGYEDCLSDYRFELMGERRDQWRDVARNKLAMHLLSGAFADRLPALYGVLLDGELRRYGPSMSTPPGGFEGSTDVVETLDACLRAEDALVLKPVYGYSGKGVTVCRPAPGGDGYDVDGERLTRGEFVERVAELDDYLVCGYVDQADYAATLFPDSVNTLRIVTLWDPGTDEPFVSAAVQRIGTDETAPVDNWSQGGLSAEVRPDGTLSSATQWSEATNETLRHATHPDTGVRIEGTAVPNWPAIRDRVLELVEAVPYLPRIGWDVVVTDEAGGFVVLELNAHPGIETIQSHRPLLRDPRVRRFYEHHGFV
jgi:hypothetical protein